MTTITVDVEWVHAHVYCKLKGESMHAVESHIRNAEWAAGLHYKRTGPRTLWINLKATDKWVTNHPHVESTSFPKASKSEKVNAAIVSA